MDAEAAYEAGELAHAFMTAPSMFVGCGYTIERCQLTVEKCVGHCDEVLWVFDTADTTDEHTCIYPPIRCGRPLMNGDEPHTHCFVPVSKTAITAGGLCMLTKCDRLNHCDTLVESHFIRRDWDATNKVSSEDEDYDEEDCGEDAPSYNKRVPCGLLLPCAIHG
jgi:hypothetical protein